MNSPIWRELAKITVPAKPPDALWTLVHKYVAGPAKLKIQATGQWSFVNTASSPPGLAQCGPDGSRKAGFSAETLITTALLGALIGKVGGSAAEKPAATAFTFVAGSYVVIVFDAKVEGGLYLTMNDLPAYFEDHTGELAITIEEARSG